MNFPPKVSDKERITSVDVANAENHVALSLLTHFPDFPDSAAIYAEEICASGSKELLRFGLSRFNELLLDLKSVFSGFALYNLISIIENGYSLEELSIIVSSKNPDGTLLFSRTDCNAFHSNRVDVKALVELMNLEVVGRGRLFDSAQEAIYLLSDGLTVAEIDSFAKLRNDQGDYVFSDPQDIRLFHKKGGSYLRSLALLEIRDHAGHQLFETGDQLYRIQSILEDEPSLFAVTEKRYSDGRSIFCYGDDLIAFLSHGGSLSQLSDYTEMAREVNLDLNGSEIATLQEIGISPAKARKLLRAGVSPIEAGLIDRIRFARSEYRFNGRPRALVIMAMDDPPGMFAERVFMDSSIGFFRTLGVQYDLKLKCVNSRKEALSELRSHGDPELVVIAGHGTKNSIALGRDLSRYGRAITEEDRKLEVGDMELLNLLRTLPGDTTIFLDSCSNASGGIESENMASFLGKGLPDKNVIASQVPFSFSEISFHSVAPFVISVFEQFIQDRTTCWRDGRGTDQLFEPNWLVNIQYTRLSLEAFGGSEIKIGDSEERQQLALLVKEQSLYSYPFIYPKELQRVNRLIGKVGGYSTFFKSQIELDKQLDPALYALGMVLKLSWCPAYSPVLGIHSRLYRDTVQYLAERGFYPTTKPAKNDLVVYISHDKEFDRYQVAHFGVFDGDKVISKMKWCDGYRHPLHAIPSQLGDYAVFFSQGR